MGSFDKYSNYTESTPYTSVIFGSNKPVLETELNEMQQIMDSKLAKALRVILGKTSSITPLSADSITTGVREDGTYYVTVKDCIIVANNGWIVYVDNTTVNVDATNRRVFFALTEKTLNYNSTVKQYGDELGEDAQNMIKDERFPTETTRRKIITYKLRSGAGIPNETQADTRYINIADFDASNGTFKLITQDSRITKLEKQLNGISLSIEDGVLVATVPKS